MEKYEQRLNYLLRYLEILVQKSVNGPNNDKIYNIQIQIEDLLNKFWDTKF
jgi:hypothetical protein